MRPLAARNGRFLACIAAAGFGIAAVPGTALAAQITEITPSTAIQGPAPVAIGDSGIVVGDDSAQGYGTPTPYAPFRWLAGSFTMLESPSQSHRAQIYDVNGQGDVAGATWDAANFELRGTIWPHGTTALTLLPSLHTGDQTGADAVNSTATVVGHEEEQGYSVCGSSPSAACQVPVMWASGGAVSEVGTGYGNAVDINSGGAVLVNQSPAGNTALPVLPAAVVSGGQTTTISCMILPAGLNDSGTVVGRSATPPNGAVFSTAGHYDTCTQLPSLPNQTASEVVGVNNAGVMVGASGNLAAMWTPNGAVTDLNSLLPANSGWVLQQARDINNNGQVVGAGTLNGQQRAFVLSTTRGLSVRNASVAEPSTGSTNVAVTVTLSDPSSSPVTVDYSTRDGTPPNAATASHHDYTPTTGSLTFTPGQTTQTFTVQVNATGLAADSNFGVQLSNPANAAIDAGLATVLIQKPRLDFQVEGLEVTQGIQKPVWATPAEVGVPGVGSVPGGSYSGVSLVRDVPTVVRVYASTVPGPGAESHAGVTAVLRAYSGGRELAGSPIAASGARTLAVGPALPAARLMSAGAYTFTLPPAWTEHAVGDPVTLVAEVNPKVGDKRPIEECAGCEQNDYYALTPLGFKVTRPITIRPFQIVYTYPLLPGHRGTGRRMQGPDLRSMYDRARDVLPLAPNGLQTGAFPGPVIDITQDVRADYFYYLGRGTTFANPNFQQCIFDPVCRDAIQALEFHDINRDLPPASDPHAVSVGFTPMPDGVSWPAKRLSIIGPGSPPRPMTITTHELLHIFGIQHASGCNGGGSNGQRADPWPPDEKGYIHGVGLDRRPNSGGGGLYRIIADGIGQPRWYDLMSYCANLNDTDAWISTDNWERFIRLNPSGSAAAASAAAATGGTNLGVDATIGFHGHAQILGAYTTTKTLTRSVPSSYHLKVLDGAGHVVKDLGVAPEQISDSPLQMFSVAVPTRGAQTIELIHHGHVIARERRPSPAPRVRVITPRRGAIHSRHRLIKVSWRRSGARGVSLSSKVQYLPRGQRIWQTLTAGIVGQSATVPVALFAGARHARIRIVVNDGFSDAVAASTMLTIPRR